MLFDSSFIRDSFLKKHLTFSKHFDPFNLKPAMVLENNKNRSEDQDIFFELIRPTELDMDKITKALVVLAEEEYDEDQQSRFINERKNYGQLQQRKQFIERRRDTLGLRNQSEKVLPQFDKPLSSSRHERPAADSKDSKIKKTQRFTSDKKAGNT